MDRFLSARVSDNGCRRRLRFPVFQAYASCLPQACSVRAFPSSEDSVAATFQDPSRTPSLPSVDPFLLPSRGE